MSRQSELGAEFRLRSTHLAEDVKRVQDRVQQSMRKTFQGAGKSGIATDPSESALGILGLPSPKKTISKWSAEVVREMKINGQRFKSLRYKAMEEMSKRGAGFSSSQDLISQQAKTAMEDYKKNQSILNNPPPILKAKTSSAATFLKSALMGLGIGSGIQIFRTAAQLFKSGVDNFLGAIDSGFKLYTSAAAQGINTRFAASRSAVSGMLGVSGDSNEVFKFGAAMQELTKRTTFATDILSKNSRTLFNASVNFKQLKLDMDALWSTIATKLAPSINLVVFLIDNFVKSLIQLVPALMDSIKAAAGPSAWLFGAAANKFSKATQLSPVMTGMKQLPASALEHMGLVIGAGGNSAAQQTAHNTGKMVKILGGIAASLGTPNKNFGLNPTLNTP